MADNSALRVSARIYPKTIASSHDWKEVILQTLPFCQREKLPMRARLGLAAVVAWGDSIALSSAAVAQSPRIQGALA